MLPMQIFQSFVYKNLSIMITKSFLSFINPSKHNSVRLFGPLTANKHFKSDIKANEDDELKGRGRKNSQSQMNSLEDIEFLFPFEWTLQSNNFKYYDPRFTEQPLKKNLQASEMQHILYVLQNLEGYLNSGTLPAPQQPKDYNKKYTQEALKNYLHSSFSPKLPVFLESLKTSELSIKLHILKDSVTKSQGYMEMQANNSKESNQINFLNPKFIHEYDFTRKKQLLLVEQKKKKAKKSQEELLQQDVKDLMDQKSRKKQLRQFFEEVHKQKPSEAQQAANYLKEKMKSLMNKKPQKKKQQESYATSELIKGKVEFKVFYKNSLICDDETDLHTKWMYVVEKNEPESIKKSRKRILYDFQFWNRGSFFEVKDWVKDIEG